MPRKYPPNTYGYYLEDLAERLHNAVQDIGKRYQDFNWLAAYEMSKTIDRASPEFPEEVDDWIRDTSNAGQYLCKMRLMQKMMNDNGMTLDDPTPGLSSDGYSWDDKLHRDADNEYTRNKTVQKLFLPEYFDESRRLFHLDGPEPPALEQVLLPFNEMMGERQSAIEAVKVAAEERKAPAKALLDNLKKSEQKSFYGAIKSFFVGNSKEYDAALKAVEGLANGTGDAKKAKKAIEQYLDLRGNKVRDHQFGRDRFDAMMKSLALVSTPGEFMEYCDKIEQARFDRSKGAYEDMSLSSEYMDISQFLKGKEERKQRDAERLEKEEKNMRLLDYRDFANDLKKLKDEKEWDPELRRNLKEFMEEHPMVREAAQEFIEKNGLKFRVPNPPEEVSRDLVDKMEAVNSYLRGQLIAPQKEQQRQSQGPEA